MSNKVVVRVLIYEGSEDWVNTTLEKSIQDRMNLPNGGSIRSITLSPELLKLFIKEVANA